MLRVNDREIEICGCQLELMVEYTMLTHRLMEVEAFTKEDVDRCVELASKSEEDVQKEAKETVLGILDGLKNIL